MEVLKLAHGYRVEWRDINDIRMVHQGTGSLLAKSIGIGGKYFVCIVSNFLRKMA